MNSGANLKIQPDTKAICNNANQCHSSNHFYFFFFLPKYNYFIYLLIEKESASGRGVTGEGGREFQAGSTLTGDPDSGLVLPIVRSGPEPKSRVRYLTD